VLFVVIFAAVEYALFTYAELVLVALTWYEIDVFAESPVAVYDVPVTFVSVHVVVPEALTFAMKYEI